MRRTVLTMTALVALGVLSGCEKQQVTTAPASQPQAKVLASWNFDEVPAGQLPESFVAGQNNPTKALATWQVTADSAAVTEPNVLAVETQNDNATFNLLLAEGTSFQEIDASVKVRGRTGEHDQGGGLIWRAKDENNYYVCRMNPLETNFRVYKIVDGKRKQLQTAEGVQTESNKWYDVRAVMVGDHIQCYLDGKKLLDVRDEEFKEAGMVGLWTKADASSSFDNFLISEPSQAQAATQPE